MKHYSKNTIREKRAGYAFSLPAVIFLLVIVVYPLMYNISMSFKDVTLETFNTEQVFIGFQNYKEVLAMPMVQRSIFNTLFFTIVSLIFQFMMQKEQDLKKLSSLSEESTKKTLERVSGTESASSWK